MGSFLGILEERGGPWAVHLLCRSLGAVRNVFLEAGGQHTDSSVRRHHLSVPSTPPTFSFLHIYRTQNSHSALLWERASWSG